MSTLHDDAAWLSRFLDDLIEGGAPVPCRQVDHRARDLWISEDLEELALAARMCLGCRGRVDCEAYGLRHPKEAGVYGGLLPQERRPKRGRPTKTTREDDAA